MARIKFKGVTKTFSDGTIAVRDLDLEVADGDFMILVGPSGCGKTTALRMVAGFEEVTAGSITMDERTVNDLEPGDRDVAMIFQNYALFPHMSVRKNIAFPLKMRGRTKQEIATAVAEVAELLGLTTLLDRLPSELSGGQRQRVAMGRALVRHPAVFLMDEPLSNLDAKLRSQMRSELARLHQRLGVTTLYVTHDQTEAMTLGTHVAVMRDGVLQQVGPPRMLYRSPANLFVARFLGSPPMNLMAGDLDGDKLMLHGGNGAAVSVPHVDESHDRPVVVGIRPEAWHVGRSDSPDTFAINGRVEVVEDFGDEVVIHFVLDQADAEYALNEDGEPMTSFTARLPPEGSVEPSDTITLQASISRIHLFDPETGQTLVMPRASENRKEEAR